MTTKAGYYPASANNSTKSSSSEERTKKRARMPVAATSRAAYEKASARRWKVYQPILDLYTKYGPMVDDQLYARYLAGGYPVKSRQCIGTARCELADGGRVYDTGETGLSDMGNRAIIWNIQTNTTGEPTAHENSERVGELIYGPERAPSDHVAREMVQPANTSNQTEVD